MNLNSKQHKKWLQKRKYTFIAFSIQMIIIGMEYSLTIITLWLYIKEMINTNSPKLYYSLVSVSYMVASTLLTPFVGRLADRNRDTNKSFLICNFLMLSGNVLYSIHFSPFYLIGGRIIAGFGGALKSIIFSETIRSYVAYETNSKLSILSIMLNFGFMLGPGINFFFKDINFYIGRWHLKDVNFPGLFLGFLCFAMEIVSIIMVHDLSKEFDYKAFSENGFVTNEVSNEDNKIEDKKIPLVQKNGANKETSVIEAVPETTVTETTLLLPRNSNQHSVKKILKELFTNFDSALLMFSNFFLAFFFINTDLWLPLLVIEKMHLSMVEMNISFFGVSGICALMLVIFIWRPISDKKIITFFIISLGGFCTVSVGFIILSYFPYNKFLNIFLCIIYMVSFAGTPIVVYVFFVNTQAKMVNSSILTFVDSIRSSIYSVGAFLAFCFSAFIFDYVEIFGTLYAVIMIVIGILFILRNKHMINPKQFL
ncbi:uncharacterized protein LOC101238818 [Hydra vulgaris]|uniref:uncharacterized protein LOC101238818 n=1 Tax=Hydra vulgaris TaxID=6087 RepID=UPI000641387B|nr:uncharacterized protein LOC101238818 [Hydra vulgaris]XP_047145193.1 uncharacterized protein LOC101238818 [Hydra vulgaris]